MTVLTKPGAAKIVDHRDRRAMDGICEQPWEVHTEQHDAATRRFEHSNEVEEVGHYRRNWFYLPRKLCSALDEPTTSPYSCSLTPCFPPSKVMLYPGRAHHVPVQLLPNAVFSSLESFCSTLASQLRPHLAAPQRRIFIEFSLESCCSTLDEPTSPSSCSPKPSIQPVLPASKVAAYPGRARSRGVRPQRKAQQKVALLRASFPERWASARHCAPVTSSRGGWAKRTFQFATWRGSMRMGTCS
jgi:hypothetical protein